ncbi:MBL fold metallo-hydrolase [Thermodesulfatator autotrophicus]|nr:MBL fold metallo-hydrolase [Thermodesulfatator autotrophicus]
MKNCEDYSLLEIVRQKKHHQPDGRFKNPWLPYEAPKLAKIFKWKLSHLIVKENSRFPVFSLSPSLLCGENGPIISFLAHNTVFLRLSGKNFLFDPIFGNISGIIKRHTPPPLAPENLPPIDFIIYSHAHRDHLDLQSLRKIPGTPKIITPLNFSLYLGNSIVELDWLETYEESSLLIRAVPVQHWSKRNIGDTNLALWAGFIIETPEFKIFFGGDTGYFFGFKELGALFGPFDLALVPSGAYLPRELMAPFHLSPEEAVKVCQELGASLGTPIHWGAYKLGDEALDDPPKLFKKQALKQGVKPLIIYPGEVVFLSNGRPVFLTS